MHVHSWTLLEDKFNKLARVWKKSAGPKVLTVEETRVRGPWSKFNNKTSASWMGSRTGAPDGGLTPESECQTLIQAERRNVKDRPKQMQVWPKSEPLALNLTVSPLDVSHALVSEFRAPSLQNNNPRMQHSLSLAFRCESRTHFHKINMRRLGSVQNKAQRGLWAAPIVFIS